MTESNWLVPGVVCVVDECDSRIVYLPENNDDSGIKAAVEGKKKEKESFFFLYSFFHTSSLFLYRFFDTFSVQINFVFLFLYTPCPTCIFGTPSN